MNGNFWTGGADDLVQRCFSPELIGLMVIVLIVVGTRTDSGGGDDDGGGCFLSDPLWWQSVDEFMLTNGIKGSGYSSA